MRYVGRAVMIAAVSLAVAQVVSGQQTTRSNAGLQRLLEEELARFPGKAGIWVKHLKVGDEAAVRADETFNSASVIKIPVLVRAFQMADKGELSLAQRITITAADVRGGSGIFRFHDPGLQPTLRDVLLQMIITSDNTATDLAIARVGGVDRVNAWLRGAGYGESLTLNMTTGELFSRYGALPKDANWKEKTNVDRALWLGGMTPRATGRMVQAIQQCSDGTAATPPIAARTSCADMMRMMRAQQSGARRLPHFVDVQVAHKTGDIPPVVANDVGVVFARSGPIVVSFFGNAIQGSYGEAEDHIGRIAQLIVAYYDGAP